MVRLVMLLLSLLVIASSALTLRACQLAPRSVQPATPEGATSIVALQGGATLVAPPGTIGRDLVNWMASGNPGPREFDLGGREFDGRSAEPSNAARGRIPRLIAMLKAYPDVKLVAIGHCVSSGDRAADARLSLARAQRLVFLLQAGGIGSDRMAVRGTDGGSNDRAPYNGADRVSIILNR